MSRGIPRAVSMHMAQNRVENEANLCACRMKGFRETSEPLRKTNLRIVKNRNPPAGNSVEGFRAFMVRFS